MIRYAQAQQLKEINGLYEDRQRVIGAFREGDPALHVIGQVSLARNISPGAAGSQFGVMLFPDFAHQPRLAEARRAEDDGEPRTAVAGGDSNVPGIWGASLFMFLVVSMLNTYGLGAGIRLIMTGLIIISVIMLAGGRRAGMR